MAHSSLNYIYLFILFWKVGVKDHSFLPIYLSSNAGNICNKFSFLSWHLCKKLSCTYLAQFLGFCFVPWFYASVYKNKQVSYEFRQFYFYLPNFRHIIFFLFYSKSRPSIQSDIDLNCWVKISLLSLQSSGKKCSFFFFPTRSEWF